MKRTDIVRALERGDINPDDLRDILKGWRPRQRGSKPNLMRQARLLAAIALLSGYMGRTKAKEVLLASGGLSSMSAFDRTLVRASKNWTMAPPFDPVRREDGKTELAIMLHCQHRDHYGYHTTISLIAENWSF